MTNALIVIDAQKYWAEGNPETARRLEENMDALRGKFDHVIWVYANNADLPFDPAPPQQVGNRQLKDIQQSFNDPSAMYSPVIQPAAEDWMMSKGSFDAFSNPYLKSFLAENRIDSVAVSGFMKGYCVFATGASAVKEGFATTLLEGFSADKGDRSEFEDGKFQAAGIKIKNAAQLGLVPADEYGRAAEPSLPPPSAIRMTGNSGFLKESGKEPVSDPVTAVPAQHAPEKPLPRLAAESAIKLIFLILNSLLLAARGQK